MRIVMLPFVAHIGRLDIEEKNNGSYEGAGVSVSVHPAAWGRIARIGLEGFILKREDGENIELVDAKGLSKRDKETVIAWARDEGLVEDREVWIASYLDENDRRCFFECATREAAKDEVEDLPRRRITGPKTVTTATKKLLALEGQSQTNTPSSSLTFDLALMQYVQAHSDFDGLWWNEELDVDEYSAPRGVIFSSKLERLELYPMDFKDLEEYDNILDEDLKIAEQMQSTKNDELKVPCTLITRSH